MSRKLHICVKCDKLNATLPYHTASAQGDKPIYWICPKCLKQIAK